MAPLIRTFPPDADGLGKLKNDSVGLNVKYTVCPHAGVYVVVNTMSFGCVSIPILKVVETGDV